MVSVTRRPGCHRVAGIRHFFKKNIKKSRPGQTKQKKKKPFLFFLFFLLCGKWVNSPAGTILSLRCCGNTHAFGLEGGSFVWEAVASPMLWHGTYLTSAFFFFFFFFRFWWDRKSANWWPQSFAGRWPPSGSVRPSKYLLINTTKRRRWRQRWRRDDARSSK